MWYFAQQKTHNRMKNKIITYFCYHAIQALSLFPHIFHFSSLLVSQKLFNMECIIFASHCPSSLTFAQRMSIYSFETQTSYCNKQCLLCNTFLKHKLHILSVCVHVCACACVYVSAVLSLTDMPINTTSVHVNWGDTRTVALCL